MTGDILGVEMGVGVENQPGEKAEKDEIVPITLSDSVNDGIREDEDRGDRENASYEVDDVINRKRIDFIRNKTKQPVHRDDHPDLDGGAHLAVELPESQVGMSDISKFPSCKLKDLRVFVSAEMAEISPT